MDLRAARGLHLALAAALAFPAGARAGPVIAGPVEAELSNEFYRQVVKGDGGRSFLTSGNFYQNNLNLFLNRPSKDGPSLTGQLNLQRSDDPLVQNRQGTTKVLGGFFAAEKAQRWRFEGGNVVPKATRATLTATVLGAGGYHQWNRPGGLTRLALIGGQVQPASDGTQFARTVFGGTLTQMAQGDQGSLKLLGNLYRVEDHEGSIRNRLGLTRVSLTVGSVAAEAESRTGLALGGELAFAGADNKAVEGNSVRVSPSYAGDLLRANANFERNSPRFANPVASAAADTKKIDGSLSVGTVHQLAVSSLMTQDNVEGQGPTTTRTHMTTASGKWVPFHEDDRWKGFAASADYNLSRSRTTAAADTESRQTGLAASLDVPAVSTELRGEWAPTRDLMDPANDRDAYRGKWRFSIKLKSLGGDFKVVPDWSGTIERSRSRATRLSDQASSLGAGVLVSYREAATLNLRHELQETLSKPSGRRVRVNSSTGSLKLQFTAKVPVTFTLSGYHKHFYDSALNAFTEDEARAALALRF